MAVNLNWIAAILGCAALFIFWLWQRASGVRGFLFMLVGDVIIFGAVLYEQNASRFPDFLGVLLAVLVLGSLLFCLGKLIYPRWRQRPRYRAPNEMEGRCSACSKQAHLRHYEQGWLCPSCTHRRDAKAA